MVERSQKYTRMYNRDNSTRAYLRAGKEAQKMRIKMVIDTHKEGEEGNHRSVVWEGELEILDKREYLMMISVMAEGEMQPICQIPFAVGMGHYLWVPPDPKEDPPIEIWR
jgi:hypothetical protein